MILGFVMMCPDCSGVVCQSCLNKLPRVGGEQGFAKCAKCRQNSKEFVRARQIEELRDSSLLKSKELCQDHKLEKVFVCFDCQLSVCPICFYELDVHKGHQKYLVESLYEDKKAKLEEQMVALEATSGEFKRQGEELDVKIS